MEKRKKVLIFIDWFYPGYKAGGPVKSMYAMIGNLEEHFDFYIVTSDRDFGSKEPYENIIAGQWQQSYGAHIMYLSPERRNMRVIGKIVSGEFDVVYVNGIFSPVFSLYPVLAFNASHKNDGTKLIVSPRGMLGDGALKIKSFKKTPYLLVAKMAGWYKNAYWHATGHSEAEEITRHFPKNKGVVIAENFIFSDSSSVSKTVRDESRLRLVFLSRISPKKNLDFALEILKKIPQGIKVVFDIYGPVEDVEYWDRCEAIMEHLPSGVTAEYKGEVHPEKIHGTLSVYHAFLFPTRHENFGHVIVEALQAGLVPIISDQTPWNDIGSEGLGYALSLDNPAKFVEAVVECYQNRGEERLEKNRQYIGRKMDLDRIKRAYIQMFKGE